MPRRGGAYESSGGVEPVNDAFDRAAKSRTEIIKKVRAAGGSLKLSDVQAIAESHGADFATVLQMLQYERSCRIDVKNNRFSCGSG